ncbi:hypothetical protein GALMADRAFT_241811 [Galerina marginata CBS 339.88]|uniref:Uncharacterized protein n=1 Tax=Galerina marginata (strain CBS 339.88) TaxID=685588 RepID=A0A067TN17_GALM3|nr:hypothetical protein GALMADRAFT_241811 [Galerina marginata CBS 339.88]
MSVIASGFVVFFFDVIKVPKYPLVTLLFFAISGSPITALAGTLWTVAFVILFLLFKPVFKYHDSRLFRSSLISP